MQRITITIDDDLLATVDLLVQDRGYDSRSAALREIVRTYVRQDGPDDGGAPCIAALSCVYDHAVRDLAKRMADTQHDHHDLVIASMHVPLNHGSCLEVSALRGPVAAVRRLADALTSQRGVRHANLHLVPVEVAVDSHDHGDGGAPHEHIRA